MFYGGDIVDMQGSITKENLDMILDLIDEYIELVEEITEDEQLMESQYKYCTNCEARMIERNLS